MKDGKCSLCGNSRVRPTDIPFRCAIGDEMFAGSRIVKCEVCGLLQYDKNLTEAEIRAYYAETYDRQGVYGLSVSSFPKDGAWGVSRGRAFVKLLESLDMPIDRHARVCDVGCAFGHILFGIREHYDDVTLIGIDYDLTAKETFRTFNGTFLAGDIDDYVDGLNGSIDLLITCHVLEHIIDPNSFMQKCRRLLKGNGVILFEVPHMDGFHMWCGERTSPHVCYYTRRTVRRCFETNGFEIVFMEYVGKKYRWFDRRVWINTRLLRKLALRTFYRRAAVLENRPVDFCRKDSVGYSLDQYGGSARRNIRVVAKLAR